jgi:hypothetical protein
LRSCALLAKVPAGDQARTFAHATFACPSTGSGEPAAWYFIFFVCLFFAPPGKNDTQRIENRR